jgi:hypothetical protein
MDLHDHSWLKLIAFFAVTTLASSLLLAAVLASVTVAIAGGESLQISDERQVGSSTPGQMFSGVITDARCGSRHTDSQQSASECVRMCVGKGSRYSIVNGDRSFELIGNLDHVSQLAGQRVSLIGVLSGNTINVGAPSFGDEDLDTGRCESCQARYLC